MDDFSKVLSLSQVLSLYDIDISWLVFPVPTSHSYNPDSTSNFCFSLFQLLVSSYAEPLLAQPEKDVHFLEVHKCDSHCKCIRY